MIAIDFGAFIAADRATVLFSASNANDYEVQCDSVSVRAKFADGMSGSEAGVADVSRESFLIPAQSSQFQLQGGLETLRRIRAQFPNAVVKSLEPSSLQWKCAPAALPVVSISASGDHSCAIERRTGKVFCWGALYSSVPAPLPKPSAITNGWFYTCALAQDSGNIKCWGMDDDTNQSGLYDVPAAPAGYSKVQAGKFHTCAIRKDDSKLVCWGDKGQVNAEVPADLPAVTEVSAGEEHTCAIEKATQKVRCFGETWASKDIVAVPPDLGPVTFLSTGAGYACAIQAGTEALRCWGAPGLAWTKIPSNLGRIKSVAAGLSHICAVTKEGKAVCFGTYDSPVNTVPPSLPPLSTVAMKGYHACALSEGTNKAFCWGDNPQGQTDVPAFTPEAP
jgi:alpha-tubulin suppressor-like RCC1 family protein